MSAIRSLNRGLAIEDDATRRSYDLNERLLFDDHDAIDKVFAGEPDRPAGEDEMMVGGDIHITLPPENKPQPPQPAAQPAPQPTSGLRNALLAGLTGAALTGGGLAGGLLLSGDPAPPPAQVQFEDTDTDTIGILEPDRP